MSYKPRHRKPTRGRHRKVTRRESGRVNLMLTLAALPMALGLLVVKL